MTSEFVLARAESSLLRLKKEQSTLEEMRRVARESLAYLKLERAALDEVLESKDGLAEDLTMDEDELELEDDEMDFDPLELLAMANQEGSVDEDISKYFNLPDDFGMAKADGNGNGSPITDEHGIGPAASQLVSDGDGDGDGDALAAAMGSDNGDSDGDMDLAALDNIGNLLALLGQSDGNASRAEDDRGDAADT